MMLKRGMTLVELLITLALAGIIFLAIFHVSVIAGKQIGVYVERYNAYNQIGYALDDMALRLPTASKIRNPLKAQAWATHNSTLFFNGTLDVYNITAYKGDTEYRYGLNAATGDLVLEDLTHGRTEILIEKKFDPVVEFSRNPDMEPNFLLVVITVNCSRSASIGLRPEVVKAEGIKFWFTDAVTP
jgi:prepilin-type N-terminal cleavage/methylation domain-containing protein